MEIESIKPFLAVLVPFIGAGLIIWTRRNPDIREACSLGTAILKLLIVLSMVPAVLAGNTLHFTMFEFWPTVPIGFRVDGLGLLFALVAAVTWVLTTLYSIGYMRGLDEHSQTRFYVCFALTLSATMGAAFSNNWFTLFIFYELITFFTYPLVAHHETKEAWAGGNKYLLYLLATSKLFLTVAILLTYYFTGTIAFTATGVLTSEIGSTMLIAMFFLYLFGVAKAAIMPFSAWLPASMVAPTPVSALLHAVAVVNTGAFCILRVVFNTFGVELMKTLDIVSISSYIACFTIIMASIYALSRDNLKERIAYSTVSQLSYMVLGGVLLTPSGMTGGVMHIANHAFAKITLFFCAGSIYVASRRANVSQLNGIGRKMPWTMGAFAIATLSMVGVPPASGFLSKWYLSMGAIEAHEIPVLFVMLASGLLNAGYFIPIVHQAFFKAPDVVDLAVAGDKDGAVQQSHPDTIKEASRFVVVPLCVTAAISVLLGVFPDLLLGLIKQVIG